MLIARCREKIRNSDGMLLVLYTANILVLSLMQYFHEPWRDEIEMWLMARDATLPELIALVPDMGTPLLWPLLLKPFALLGFSLTAMKSVQLVLALATSWLILFRAPFSTFFKFLLLSSYHIHFEYGVISRNYTLGVLLLFVLAALDERRSKHIWWYGIVLLLLCQTSVHFWFVSSALCLVLGVEMLKTRNRDLLPGVLLGVAGSVLTLLMMLPSGQGQFTGTLVSTYNPQAALIAMMGALFPQANGTLYAFAALWFWLLLLVSMIGNARLLAIAVFSLSGVFYIFCFKHIGGAWHFGLLIVLLVFFLWLRNQAKPTTAPLAKIAEALITPLIYISLAYSVFVNTKIYYVEFAFKHSLSGEMASILKENDLLTYRIAAHPAPVAAAVLGYLPGKKFWYPSIRDFGTHMLWDKEFASNRFITSREVFDRVKQNFPDWNKTKSPVMVMLNELLAEPELYGYVLYFATPDTPWRAKDERYYLYVPIEYAKWQSNAS